MKIKYPPEVIITCSFFFLLFLGIYSKSPTLLHINLTTHHFSFFFFCSLSLARDLFVRFLEQISQIHLRGVALSCYQNYSSNPFKSKMRHGRAKAARKTLAFFERTAGIKAPYHIILDGTFLVALVKYKFPLRERLDKLLQHAFFTLYTTNSVIEELKALKEAAAGDKKKLLEDTLEFANDECEIVSVITEMDEGTKTFVDAAYPDYKDTLSAPGLDLLKLCLPSKEAPRAIKYFVACHDEDLLDMLRSAGTVPCLRLARGSVLLLENPSKSGQRQATKEEQKKWAASGSVREEERLLVEAVRAEKRNKLDNSSYQASSVENPHARKKRKAKEPNPLSCKKKKASEGGTKKRRRRRKGGAAEDN